MKNTSLFWGSLFIALGIIFAADKFSYGYNYVDLYVGDLWPIILISWGVFVISTQKTVRTILSIVNGVLVALLIYNILFDRLFFWGPHHFWF